MRYLCNECGEIIDEGDLVIEDESFKILCPKCQDSDVVKLDDSEYGN